MLASLRGIRWVLALGGLAAVIGGQAQFVAAQEGNASKPAATSPNCSQKKADEAAAGGSPCSPRLTMIARGTLRTEITLEGIFEAKNMAELVLRPKEWSEWSVLSVVPHGTRVAAGDILLSFDTEKIDRAIADLRYEQRLGELALRQAEQELRTLESLTPLEVAASDRAQKIAEEDAKLYADIGKPQAVKAADFALKAAKERLENQEEELHQLEKMYKADDLTEETEKIVLKRARDAVDQARFLYETAKIDHDETLKYTIPRAAQRIKDVTERTKATEEKNRAVMAVALQKQRIELDKLKLQRVRGDDKLAKMLADREMMTVKAPVAGIVYYGSCQRGKWSATGDELRRGATVAANKTFMTVVEPRPIFIRAGVTEKQLAGVRAGQTGDVKPTAFPQLRLKAIVESVGAVPLDGGIFDCRLSVALAEGTDAIVPGMNCEVRLVPLEKAGVLLAPATAVVADDCEESKFHVLRIGPDGKPQKTPVTIGKRNERQVEILTGLSEGDQVVTEPSKDKK